MNTQPLVLVSGATGFLACHVIKLLLQANYKVRGTVRSLKNTEKNDQIKAICPEKVQNLELVEANLLDNNCWKNIMTGCDYVIHAASPFPSTMPKDPNELIKPALEGAEAIMNAAVEAKIKQIVMTSSIASILSGQKKNYLTAEDWSNPDTCDAYEKSKLLAEQKAWEIYKQQKSQSPQNYTKLTVMCPSLILGPTLTNYASSSGENIIKMMKNEIPALAKMSIGYVDVRDVAEAHVKALEIEKTDGQRYILNEGSYWMEDTANIMRDEFAQYGYKIPSCVMGKTMVTIAGWFDDIAKQVKKYINRMIIYDNTPSRKDLGIIYKCIRETLIDSGYNYIEKGLVPDKINKNKIKNKNKK